ncbi:MAG: hypothetical protein R3B13_21355 [Polyangiaceae bacterium]
MYFSELAQLEFIVFGYGAALRVHDVEEGGPQMHHFREWPGHKTGWAMACGWARAITEHTRKNSNPADNFFRLLDEFRLLKPVRMAWVQLRPRHQPTGKRVMIGGSGRMGRPNRVEIIRYRPEPLHFLRFHYREHMVDDHLLHNSSGSYKTTLRDAKRWVADELQVQASEWRSTR